METNIKASEKGHLGKFSRFLRGIKILKATRGKGQKAKAKAKLNKHGKSRHKSKKGKEGIPSFSGACVQNVQHISLSGTQG